MTNFPGDGDNQAEEVPPDLPLRDEDFSPYIWSDEGDPFPQEIDPLAFWGVPDFPDIPPQDEEVDPPEWDDFPQTLFGDKTETDYYIVDLAQIPKEYTLRAKIFFTLGDAISYLRKAGVLAFSTVIRDTTSGVFRVAIATTSPPRIVSDEDSSDGDSEIEF